MADKFMEVVMKSEVVTGKCEHDWDMDNPSCVFGCNRVVDDYGICPECKDHSNNVVTCMKCGEEGDVDTFDGKVTERKY